jgi:hypothetical protein
MPGGVPRGRRPHAPLVAGQRFEARLAVVIVSGTIGTVMSLLMFGAGIMAFRESRGSTARLRLGCDALDGIWSSPKGMLGQAPMTFPGKQGLHVMRQKPKKEESWLRSVPIS